MAKAKEIQVKQASAPVAFEMDADLQALLPRAESSDFDIPRLTLVQPTSKIEGSPGDVIDSTTNAKVIGLNQKLTFIPIWFFKDFSITEVESKKWRRNEPKSGDNAHYSLFDNRQGQDQDGVLVERKERLNLFIIQESSLGEELPRVYRLVIKPSSFKEAKKFLSEWDIQIRSRLAPFSFVWSITPKQITNEKGKFCIYEFAKEMADGKQRQVTPDQFQSVKFWVKTLAQNKDTVMKQEVRDDEVEGHELSHEAGKLNF